MNLFLGTSKEEIMATYNQYLDKYLTAQKAVAAAKAKAGTSWDQTKSQEYYEFINARKAYNDYTTANQINPYKAGSQASVAATVQVKQSTGSSPIYADPKAAEYAEKFSTGTIASAEKTKNLLPWLAAAAGALFFFS